VSETVTDVARGTMLADLAEFWQDPQPDRITGRVPSRIAGSAQDQPVPGGTQNPYWEIVRQIPLDTIGDPWRKLASPDPFFLTPDNRYIASRHALCGMYSWSIPSPGDIAWITERLGGRGVVEPGAGLGYWAWQLAQAGVDVAAYDPKDPADNHHTEGEPWFRVLRGDHDAVKHHADRSLLLCWPTYSDGWAAQALGAYQGDQLFYIGEGPGGCCADDGFFDLLGKEWEDAGDCPHHVTYSGIHCYLTEYRRKSR
jgi:hypothetical protein